MKGLKRKALSALLALTMVAGMMAPMGAQAATITSGDEYITTENGLEVKVSAKIDGDNSAIAADYNGNSSSVDGNFADVFDGNASTGVIFRSNKTNWDGYIQAGDYIQVEFKEAINFDGAAFTFNNGDQGVDGFYNAVLSYTTDGETWNDLYTTEGVVRSFNFDAEETIPGVTAIKLTNGVKAGDERPRVWVRLAEIAVDGTVYVAPVAVDKTELNAVYDEANALDPSAYVDFTGVMDALYAAFDVKEDENATQDAVDAATANLKAAMEALVKVPEPTPVPEYDIEVSERVDEMIEGMSLRDKVTQMLMVDFRKWGETTATATDFTVMNDQVQKIVEDYNFGSVIFFANNIKETEQSYNLSAAMQEAATKDGGIALLIAADQEGGSVYRLGSGTALPGNMALGATFDTENSYKAGKIIGSELDAVGINTNLAPVVDVNNNANNPVIGLRSYGDDATAVGEMAAASIEGMAEYNVIGCAKHFPGHGDTATDSHYGLPSVDKSLDVLMENELKPYTVAIEEGIEMIMTAHILYPQLESDKIVSNKTGEAESLPATMSDDILTGLLKEDMGFEGIIVTDAMNMAGISNKWDQVQSVVIAFQAGVDMICMPCQLYCEADLANLDAIIDGVVAAVGTGEIPMSRINNAVARILNVKENRGILDYKAEDHTLEKALEVVGSDENRATEREIAAKAVTVIKNTNNVLPLNITADTKVLMLVPYNNESSQMLMGWNRAVEAGIIPYGAEVDYYRFSNATINATLQAKLEWADIVIINSEISSAARLDYSHWLSLLPNKVADFCKENGKITVISSVDKPYDVQLYPNADAIVAAYGCKGSSVDPTEALIGGATGSKAAYGPNIIAAVEVVLGTFTAQGKLPVTIPVFDAETTKFTEEVAYARGYGLTYDAKEALPVDKAVLETAIAENGSFDVTNVPAAAAAAYAEALAAANAVFANEEVTQYAVEKAAADLVAAVNEAELAVAAKAALGAAVANYAYVSVADATAATAEAFNAALEAAVAELNSEEATSDSMNEAVAALEEAVAGLKTAGLVAVDSAVLAANAKANSEQLPVGWDNDGGAAWAFDEESHWWHSRYQDWEQKAEHEVESGKAENNPIWIQTGFGEKVSVEKVTYLPRQDSSKGRIKEYTLAVATVENPTDDDFTVVKEGTLENIGTEQTIVLDSAVEATYVRLTAVSGYFGYIGGADHGDGTIAAQNIKVYVVGETAYVPVVDTTALQALVDECAAVDADLYSKDSYAALTAAIEAAQAVIDAEETTSADVYAAVEALAAVKEALVERAIAAIEVATAPAKVEYTEGEAFDAAGLVITVIYDNETTETVTYGEENAADFAFAPAELTADVTAVTVTYAEKTAEIAITVAPLEVPVDPADASADVPVDMYTTSAGSSYNSTDYATDSNPSTHWEVQWDIGATEPEKLWYQIDMGQEIEIEAVRYLPRFSEGSGNQNGFILGYRVEVSVDGENWTTAAEGTWEMTGGWKLAEFEAVTARYVKLVGTNTYADVDSNFGDPDVVNSNMAIAEIRVKATVPSEEILDKGELIKAIEAAEALVAEDYKDMTAVEEALVAAEAVAANADATQEEVDAAAAALTSAIEALVKVVKKDALVAAVAAAKEIVQDLYTSATAADLAAAIAAGEALVADEEATQAAVDAAVKAIEKATKALEAKATAEEKAVLEEAVAEAEAIDETLYTEDSAADLAAAIEAAKEVLADADATAEDVEDAMADLEDAVEALETIPEPTPEVCEIFTDVNHGVWYELYVQYVYDKELMSGNDGLFKPTENVTRAQLVTTIYRLAGSPEVTDEAACEAFEDVKADKFYTAAVCWAYNEGIATGNPDTGLFGTNDTLTRQQMAAFFFRFAQYMDVDTSASADISNLQRADEVSGYAKEAVEWAVGSGLISGSLVGTDENGAEIRDLNPKGATTRAQLATILQRFCEENNL